MITALSFKDYSIDEIATKKAGLALVNIALADPFFAAAWMKETCTENQYMTQMQILELMRQDTSVEFRAYRKWWSKVIGYFVSGDIIWDNLKYEDQFTASSSGSNDLHEVAHMKGFHHDNLWYTSVPYTLNRVFERWAMGYLATPCKRASPIYGVTPPVDSL